MTDIYAGIAIAEVVIAGLLLIRLAAGPTISDRIVALNSIAAQSALALLFYAAAADREIYVDAAIWLASFSYLGTIVWARYLERGLL